MWFVLSFFTLCCNQSSPSNHSTRSSDQKKKNEAKSKAKKKTKMVKRVLECRVCLVLALVAFVGGSVVYWLFLVTSLETHTRNKPAYERHFPATTMHHSRSVQIITVKESDIVAAHSPYKLVMRYSRMHRYHFNPFDLEEHRNHKDIIWDDWIRPQWVYQVYLRAQNHTSIFMVIDSDAIILRCRTNLKKLFQKMVSWYQRRLIQSVEYTPDLIICADSLHFIDDGVFMFRPSDWTLNFIENWMLISSLWKRAHSSTKKSSDFNTHSSLSNPQSVPMKMILTGINPIDFLSDLTLKKRDEYLNANIDDKMRILHNTPHIERKVWKMFRKWNVSWKNKKKETAGKHSCNLNVESIWQWALSNESKKHVAFVHRKEMNQDPFQSSSGAEWLIHPTINDPECMSMFGWHSDCKWKPPEERAENIRPTRIVNETIDNHYASNSIYSPMSSMLNGTIHLISAYVSSDGNDLNHGQKASNAIKEGYCRKYGCKFHFLKHLDQMIDDDNVNLNHTTNRQDWIKPRWIHQVYSRYYRDNDAKLFVWMDSDALIMDCNRSIQDIFLESVYFYQSDLISSQMDRTPDLICSGDPIQSVNSGVLMFRPSQWTTKFLNDWLILSSLWKKHRNGGLKDQVALNLVLSGVTPELLFDQSSSLLANSPDQTVNGSLDDFDALDWRHQMEVLHQLPTVKDVLFEYYESRVVKRHRTRTKSDIQSVWNHSFSDNAQKHVALVEPRIMNQGLPNYKPGDWIVHPFGQPERCKDLYLKFKSRRSSCSGL